MAIFQVQYALEDYRYNPISPYKTVYVTKDIIDAFRYVGRAMLNTIIFGQVWRIRDMKKTYYLLGRVKQDGIYINISLPNTKSRQYRTLRGFSNFIDNLAEFGDRHRTDEKEDPPPSLPRSRRPRPPDIDPYYNWEMEQDDIIPGIF